MSLYHVPLFICERVNAKTPKAVAKVLMTALSTLLPYSVSLVYDLLTSGRLVSKTAKCPKLVEGTLQWQTEVVWTMDKPKDVSEAMAYGLVTTELQELAVLIKVMSKPLDNDPHSLLSTWRWATEHVATHLPTPEEILIYLQDYCPEIAYLIDASKDIGAPKALRNILTRDAQAQCWVDDVWGKQ